MAGGGPYRPPAKTPPPPTTTCQAGYNCMNCKEEVFALCTSSGLGSINVPACQEAANACPSCGGAARTLAAIKRDCYQKVVNKCNACNFGTQDKCLKKGKDVCQCKSAACQNEASAVPGQIWLAAADGPDVGGVPHGGFTHVRSEDRLADSNMSAGWTGHQGDHLRLLENDAGAEDPPREYACR